MKAAADGVAWCLVLAAGIIGVWLIFAAPHRPAAGVALVAAAVALWTTAAARRPKARRAVRG